MKIERVELYRLKVPLKQPYKIATAEMKAFDCTVVGLQAEGREGLGEAMADIQGYFWETADEVWEFARKQGPGILGLSAAQAHASAGAVTRFPRWSPAKWATTGGCPYSLSSASAQNDFPPPF